jgi:hypothetical protein
MLKPFKINRLFLERDCLNRVWGVIGREDEGGALRRLDRANVNRFLEMRLSARPG